MIGIFLEKYLDQQNTFSDQWAILTATIISEHYRKSSLFQGGFEIPCVITMIVTVCGHYILQRYEQFVKTFYAEPKDEVFIGSYLTKTDSSVIQTNCGIRAKKKKKNTKDKVKSKDIRDMLKK